MSATSFEPVREVGRTAIPPGIRRGAILPAAPKPDEFSREIRIAAWTPRSAARFVIALPAHVLLGLIWLYRRTLSPVLPVVFGPGCGCRFHPTCAVYAAQAVRERGALLGGWLALCRLLKCHPLHPGGFDPVPARRRPVARRVQVWTRLAPSTAVDPERRGLSCR